MENEELALRVTKLRREKEESKQEDISNDKDVETDDGDLKIPALPPVDGILDVLSNEKKCSS